MAIALPDLRGRVRIDDSDLDRLLRRLRSFRSAFSSFGDDASGGFRRAERSGRDAADGIDQAGDSARNLGRSARDASRGNDNLRVSMTNLVKGGLLLAGTIKLIKFPAMVSAANLAAQALRTLAAAFLGLAGAVGPALGVLAAAPGILASIGQAAGTAMLGFSGVGKALKAMSAPRGGGRGGGGAGDAAARAKRIEAADERVDNSERNRSRTQRDTAGDVEEGGDRATEAA